MVKTFFLRHFPLFLAALVFAPLWGAHFTHWDDNLNVWQNPRYLPVSLENTFFFWHEAYNYTFRPLVHTVWAALAALSQFGGPHHVPGGGETPFDARVFHGANVLLHLANTFLVQKLLRRAVKPAAAAGGALLFALHPLQVESVAWVTGFNELLCGGLCLLSVWFFLETRTENSPHKNSPQRAYALSLVFYVLALLTKPAAVALPLVLWIFDGCLQKQSWRASGRVLWPFLLLGLMWSLVTAGLQPESYAGTPPALWTRPFLAGDVWTFYGQKLILPVNLGIDYGRKPEISLQNPWVWFAWTVPALLLFWAWKIRARNVAPLLGIGVFLAWTLPVCGLKSSHFQLQFSLVADRYLYFAFLGFAFWAALWIDQWPEKRGRLQKIAAVALVLVWAMLSWRQIQIWHDNFSLFTQAIRVNPRSWLAHANLGAAYANENQTPKAAPHWQRALEINPKLWQMHVSLARYFTQNGEKNAAFSHWKAALQLKPDLLEARSALRELQPQWENQ